MAEELRAPTFALSDGDGPAEGRSEMMLSFLEGPLGTYSVSSTERSCSVYLPLEGVSSLVATSYEGGGPIGVGPAMINLCPNAHSCQGSGR